MEWKTFNLSRYYSPLKTQQDYLSTTEWYYSEKYVRMYINYFPWYEQDVCMNCWCKLKWDKKLYDCEYPANWVKLRQEQWWKVVACPVEYPLWTKFFIEWIGDVACVDRWWAIKKNRIDLWMWYWLENFSKIAWWNYRWYVKK